MMTGWIQLDGKYYYLNPANEGRMIAGTTSTINGTQYSFDASGVCQNSGGISAQTPGTVTNSPSGNSGGSMGPGAAGSAGISSGAPGSSSAGNSPSGIYSPSGSSSSPGTNSPAGSNSSSGGLEPGRTDGPG